MKKRGLGIASMIYACGFGFARPDISSASIELEEDGTATLLTGCAELGQGSNTVLSQIAAETIGINYEDIRIINGDTSITPDAGPTSASRQTYISGNAVKNAADELRKNLMTIAAELLNSKKEKIDFYKGKVYIDDAETEITVKELARKCRRRGNKYIGWGWHNITTSDVDPETNQGDAYATYIYGTQLAEVEVDTLTGQVRVLDIIAAHDVGKAINPQLVEGQIEGGIAQGLGYALMEEVILENGNTKTPSLAEYIIPTTLDMPEIKSIIVEDNDPTGPYGAKGVGEGSIIPTAPAIVNAIYDAVGVRITKLPVCPEEILEKMKT